MFSTLYYFGFCDFNYMLCIVSWILLWFVVLIIEVSIRLYVLSWICFVTLVDFEIVFSWTLILFLVEFLCWNFVHCSQLNLDGEIFLCILIFDVGVLCLNFVSSCYCLNIVMIFFKKRNYLNRANWEGEVLVWITNIFYS